ncbi:MAG: hypothetical protein JNM93_06585 [Bacteriovoracaceae bacterium]|nr:hypothetical protein [Bacteriovoracaceae bacterium]
MKNVLALLKLFIVSGLFAGKALAVNPSFKCHTPNEEKIFTIDSDKVTFHHVELFKNSREVSSTVDVTTLNSHTGFTKVMYVNGYKHRIHINDLKNMNEVDDYISIISPKGHTMTYPITCKHI